MMACQGIVLIKWSRVHGNNSLKTMCLMKQARDRTCLDAKLWQASHWVFVSNRMQKALPKLLPFGPKTREVGCWFPIGPASARGSEGSIIDTVPLTEQSPSIYPSLLLCVIPDQIKVNVHLLKHFLHGEAL
jgi:hypothetical protein